MSDTVVVKDRAEKGLGNSSAIPEHSDLSYYKAHGHYAKTPPSVATESMATA